MNNKPTDDIILEQNLKSELNKLLINIEDIDLSSVEAGGFLDLVKKKNRTCYF